MSIVFHCEHCGKRIEAKDSAGGKRGRCPNCHNRIYVPDLNADGEELKLAPVDEQEERRKQELMAETFQLSQNILEEREVGNGADAIVPGAAKNSADLRDHLVTYIRAKADGDDQTAESLLGSITSNSDKAEKILDQIALSEIPEAELADISPSDLAGIIRTLRGRLV